MKIHSLYILALSGLLLSATAQAAEETDTTNSHTSIMEPVVVSATRWETSGIPTANSITVITREQIIDSGAENVTDVLRGQGGLQITDLFGNGSRSTIDMRGFGSTGSANTLILIDGRRINNTDLASPRLNNIFLKDIERVEITHGSAAVLYGDQAVGGVVNIITRRPTEFEANVELSHGSYDFQSQQVNISNRFDSNIGFRASFERQRDDAYRDNNKSSYKNGFLNLFYEGERASVFADYNRTHEDLGLPGALTAAQIATGGQRQTVFPLDFNDSISEAARVGATFKINPDWELAAEYTHRSEDVDGVLTGLNIKQQRLQQTFNPRVRGNIRIADDYHLTLVAGVDIEDTHYVLVSPFGRQQGDQEMKSIYSLLTLPVNEYLSISGGVRKAWHDRELVDGFRFFPGSELSDNETATNVGLTFTPDDNWRFFFKREDNYRFPLLDEEMNVFTLSTPLETQTGTSYEMGGEWYNHWLQFKLTGYFMDIENEINVDPTAFLENINLESTEHSGVIVEAGISPLDNISIDAIYTYTNAEIDGGTFAGGDVPLVAENQLNVTVNYQFMPHWKLYSEVFLISERNAGGDFTGALSKLGGYGIANLNLRFDYDNYYVSARVNNILDKQYSDSASVNFFNVVGFFPAPERNFMLTGGIQF